MSAEPLLARDAIVPLLAGADAQAIFAELAAPIARSECVDAGELVASLLEREALASTAVGHGVAIPHGVHAGLTRVVASFGRASAGVELAAPDGVPVRLFVVLVRPPDAAVAHLQALARWGQLLADDELRAALLAAAGVDEILAVLERQR